MAGRVECLAGGCKIRYMNRSIFAAMVISGMLFLCPAQARELDADAEAKRLETGLARL